MKVVQYFFLLILTVWSKAQGAEKPKSLDSNFELQLFVDDSMVSTPVGCTIDGKGRLLVVESHTHFRPDNYHGPETDRILAFTDKDGDGKADIVDTYYLGGKHTMSITYAGNDSTIVATRGEIYRLDDSNRDGVADSKTNLVELETEGNYPHNGLCGLVLTSNKSKLYFGLGENLGEDYEIVSYHRKTEISRLSGGGEGGSIYSYDLNNGSLDRIATGFWNPFGICLSKHGEMFAVDNDPDQKPPNRLLKIVPGGDYGYQFRYGRPGTDPLQAWDGELPGTLPMISGTGEAACSVIPYGEHLWVSSWALGQIEEYSLTKKGSHYTASVKPIVKGGSDFRPVDFAHAEDGSVYFTDWVNASYQLHGHGKVWKLTPVKGSKPEKRVMIKAEIPSEYNKISSLREFDNDPFKLASFFWHYQKSGKKELKWDTLSENSKVALLTSISWQKEFNSSQVEQALNDKSSNVQIAAIRVIADRNLDKFKKHLEKIYEIASPDSQLSKVAESAIKKFK